MSVFVHIAVGVNDVVMLQC